ncbi:MAG TPA: YceI family protein [Chitinophagaceae bacterium]|nr:YceI family protein [Chitinophagaceae bacterium]
MKQIILISLTILKFYFATAQPVFFTKNGTISFFSRTPLENIDAKNTSVASKINTQTGDMEFQLLIKGFQFKKSSMQQHFNEKSYMDSDNFPKSYFKGKIIDLSKINFKKDGVYNITVEGDLTIHGVTKKVSTIGVITVVGEKINAKSGFVVKLADYKVSVPQFVSQKIAESVEIKVDCDYQLFKG